MLRIRIGLPDAPTKFNRPVMVVVLPAPKATVRPATVQNNSLKLLVPEIVLATAVVKFTRELALEFRDAPVPEMMLPGTVYTTAVAGAFRLVVPLLVIEAI